MSVAEVTVLDPDLPAFALAESPLWDVRDRAWYWVDITPGRIWRYDPVARRADHYQLPQKTGFIAPHSDGGFIAGLEDGLYHVDFDAERTRKLTSLPLQSTAARFNDGACDAQGRLFAGTMHDESDPDSTGALYRFDKALQIIAGDVPVSNGLAWTKDSSMLFHADTKGHCVWLYDYDLASGNAVNRRILAEFPDLLPDGLAIDGNDRLYVALYGAGKIVSLHHADGQADVIQLPVKHVTSCAFGGPDMKTLLITTAAQDKDKEQPDKQAMSGRIYCATMDDAGVPEAAFVPSSTDA